MCYSISITVKTDDLEKRFGATFKESNSFEPIYHASGFSTPFIPVISNENVNVIECYQWGLIPFWIKDEKAASNIRFRTLNARAETIFDKPSFKHSIIKNRCLVLVDGFYEWREVKGKKFPYHIKLTDDDSFALAGIWDTWENKNTGEIRKTFSIITTNANLLMAKIHNTKKRMPVILRRENEKRWLSEGLDVDEINSFLTQKNKT